MQSSKKFAASVALLAVAAMAFAGVASATVTPQGPFRAVAWGPFIKFDGPKGASEVQEEIQCHAEVLEGTVTYKVQASPAFYECSSVPTPSHPHGLGPVTIKQVTSPSPPNFEFLMGSGYTEQLHLNLQVTRTNYPACTFNLTGGLNYTQHTNSAGEVDYFYFVGAENLRVANSVTPTEHCPQLYPNGFVTPVYSEPFYITSHPLKFS